MAFLVRSLCNREARCAKRKEREKSGIFWKVPPPGTGPLSHREELPSLVLNETGLEKLASGSSESQTLMPGRELNVLTDVCQRMNGDNRPAENRTGYCLFF